MKRSIVLLRCGQFCFTQRDKGSKAGKNSLGAFATFVSLREIYFKLYRYLLLFYILLISSLPLAAQQFIFKSYTIQDGLVANTVRRIFQDAKGFMWIATWEGLSKYDGNKFTNFTTANGLSFDLINDMYEDQEGKLYVAENDGSIDIIQNDRVIKKSGTKGITVNRFFTDNGKIAYAGTDAGGLFAYREGSLKALTQQSPQAVISYARLNDSLVIVCSEREISILDKQLNIFSKQYLSQSDYNAVYRDSKNRIWLCTREGLKLINPVQKRNEPLALLPLPPALNIPFLTNQLIYDILEGSDGSLWISTNKGLVKTEPGERLRFFTATQGLPSNFFPCIFQDREKNMWLGSQQGLVKIVTQNDIHTFTTANGLTNDEVWDIIPYGKDHIGISLMVGGYQKINTHDFSISPLETASAILQSYAGQKISFSYFGIEAVDKKFFTDVFYTCGASDGKGNLFAGTSRGIIIQTAQARHDTTLSHRITTLVFDKEGYLWAGTWQNGLFRLRLNYEAGTIYFTSKDFSHLLPDKAIRSGFMDSRGNLWFGTRYKGAVKLTKTGADTYEASSYNSSHNLISNWVRSFTEDEAGNIWVGTHFGINKLKPVNNDYTIFNFSKINNIISTVNSIYAAPGGIIWCAGYPGLVRFRDDQLDTLSAPPAVITSIEAGKPEDSLDLSVMDQQPSLDYNKGLVRFEFSSPSFINEKEILYSYRLAGAADTSWSKPSNQHSVLYASLQPGNYRFEVRTLGWNGEWGEVAGYSFIIKPPFWKTWWFIMLMIVLAGCLLFLLYRYRINQLIKLQQVRNRIATDLHDDIGSTLTNISILSELSYKNLGQPQQAEKFLTRIAEEVLASGQALDDIIWSANTENDTLEETLTRMRRYAAELFDNSNIAYRLQLDDTIAGKKLNMEQRRDVFLIYKELLNNIHKHAGATQAWIEVRLKKGSIHLHIKDNGKGFTVAAATHRNGIKNIHQRVKKWKGQITIDSSAEKGTTIHILIPIA